MYEDDYTPGDDAGTDAMLAEIELAQLDGQYSPEAMRDYRALLNAGTAKEQLEFLRTLGSTRAADPEADADRLLASFDRPAPITRLADGVVLDDSLADLILSGAPNPRARRPSMADITQKGSRSGSSSDGAASFGGGASMNDSIADRILGN
jgi:hypothetical protein